MILTPIQNDNMTLCCEISRTLLYCVNMCFCMLILNTNVFSNLFGNWIYNKWTVFNHQQACWMIITLSGTGISHAISVTFNKFYEKFKTSYYFNMFLLTNLCNLVIVVAIFGNVKLFTYDNSDDFYISYFKSPNHVISVLAKG